MIQLQEIHEYILENYKNVEKIFKIYSWSHLSDDKLRNFCKHMSQ